MKREVVNRRVVMCDFDEKITFTEVKYRWKYIAKQLWPGVRFRLHFEKSPGNRGFHFWAVADRDLLLRNDYYYNPAKFRILLAQCLMGSDIKRERANLARITAGIEDWNVLFATRRTSLHNIGKKSLTKRKGWLDL